MKYDCDLAFLRDVMSINNIILELKEKYKTITQMINTIKTFTNKMQVLSNQRKIKTI